MSRVLIIGGGAAGMAGQYLQRKKAAKYMYLKKMRSWGKNYLLLEKVAAILQMLQMQRCFFLLWFVILNFYTVDFIALQMNRRLIFLKDLV